MEKAVRRFRSTASTGKLVSSIILIAAYILLAAGLIILFVSLLPTGDINANDLLPDGVKDWLEFSVIQAMKILGLSILLAWMGYLLRVMACLLESQLPDKTHSSVSK